MARKFRHAYRFVHTSQVRNISRRFGSFQLPSSMNEGIIMHSLMKAAESQHFQTFPQLKAAKTSGNVANLASVNESVSIKKISNNKKYDYDYDCACNSRISIVYRHEMMCKCWEMEPSGRPTFTELRSYFEGVLEGQHASDYVDFTTSIAPISGQVERGEEGMMENTAAESI